MLGLDVERHRMAEHVALNTIVGVWIAAFFTLCIFSFLYRDNPFYKFAEHVLVGVSAGYWMVIQYHEVLRPNLIDKLAGAGSAALQRHWSSDWSLVIPTVLGVLLVLRLYPRLSWVSRWPLAFLVGMQAGFSIVYVMEARILKQVNATILPLWVPNDFLQSLQNLIIVVGVVCGLVYFYFSIEHRGVFGGASRVGIYVLMIALGAAFGYTVMARVSLLIGRLLFFKDDFLPVTTHYFSP